MIIKIRTRMVIRQQQRQKLSQVWGVISMLSIVIWRKMIKSPHHQLKLDVLSLLLLLIPNATQQN